MIFHSPSPQNNLYPTTTKNLESLINFYFDSLEPDREGVIEYLKSKTSLKLNEIEFAVKHTSYLYTSFFLNEFKHKKLALFLSYSIDAIYYLEDEWTGSPSRKRLLGLLRNLIEPPRENRDRSITPKIVNVDNRKLRINNFIFNEEKSEETIVVTLKDFEKEFDVFFFSFGTQYYYEMEGIPESYKYVFEYRKDGRLRYADYESNYFLFISIEDFKRISETKFDDTQEFSLKISKKLNNRNIVELNIEDVFITRYKYDPSLERNDDPLESNEDWIRGEFGEDADTVFGNLD